MLTPEELNSVSSLSDIIESIFESPDESDDVNGSDDVVEYKGHCDRLPFVSDYFCLVDSSDDEDGTFLYYSTCWSGGLWNQCIPYDSVIDDWSPQYGLMICTTFYGSVFSGNVTVHYSSDDLLLYDPLLEMENVEWEFEDNSVEVVVEEKSEPVQILTHPITDVSVIGDVLKRLDYASLTTGILLVCLLFPRSCEDVWF